MFEKSPENNYLIDRFDARIHTYGRRSNRCRYKKRKQQHCPSANVQHNVLTRLLQIFLSSFSQLVKQQNSFKKPFRKIERRFLHYFFVQERSKKDEFVAFWENFTLDLFFSNTSACRFAFREVLIYFRNPQRRFELKCVLQLRATWFHKIKLFDTFEISRRSFHSKFQ